MPIDYAKDVAFMVRDAGEVCLKAGQEFHAIIEDYEEIDPHTERFIGMVLMLSAATDEMAHKDGEVVTVRGQEYTIRDSRDDHRGLVKFKISREFTS